MTPQSFLKSRNNPQWVKQKQPEGNTTLWHWKVNEPVDSWVVNTLQTMATDTQMLTGVAETIPQSGFLRIFCWYHCVCAISFLENHTNQKQIICIIILATYKVFLIYDDLMINRLVESFFLYCTAWSHFKWICLIGVHLKMQNNESEK